MPARTWSSLRLRARTTCSRRARPWRTPAGAFSPSPDTRRAATAGFRLRTCFIISPASAFLPGFLARQGASLQADKIALHWGGNCGRGVAWLTRLPVTEKIAGSNPVARASENKNRSWRPVFILILATGFERERGTKALETSSIDFYKFYGIVMSYRRAAWHYLTGSWRKSSGPGWSVPWPS